MGHPTCTIIHRPCQLYIFCGISATDTCRSPTEMTLVPFFQTRMESPPWPILHSSTASPPTGTLTADININIFIYITKTFSSFIIRISLRDTRYIYIYIILFWNFECNLFWIFSPLPLPTHITSKMDVWMSGWWWINKTRHKFEERKGKLKHFPPSFLAPVVLWSCQDLWSRLQLCGRNQIVRRTWNIKIYWFY